MVDPVRVWFGAVMFDPCKTGAEAENVCCAFVPPLIIPVIVPPASGKAASAFAPWAAVAAPMLAGVTGIVPDVI